MDKQGHGKTRTIAQTATAVVCAAFLALCVLAGCTSGQQSASSSQSASASDSASASGSSSAQAVLPIEDLALVRDTEFDDVCFEISPAEFTQHGFALGDSVDIVFSNGYELKGIPYFNGYYVNIGSPLLVGDPGHPHIMASINFGDSLFDVADLSEDDSATIALAKAGAYRSVQDAFDISYTNVRDEYESDEEFANFRSLAGGRMKQGTVYRSASPIDNECNRAAYAAALAEQARVAYVLNLSDSADEAAAFMDASAQQKVSAVYYKGLIEKGNVAFLDLGVNFTADSFAQTLAAGLADMAKHDGPYLVHCIEGKDRTGFVSILLEALCGATYDEMLADYMATYANYYKISHESEPERFEAIAGLYFDGMMRFLANADAGADLKTIDYAESARAYLRSGGMTDKQIDELAKRLTQ